MSLSPSTSGCVYIYQAGETNLYKFGQTTNLANRLKTHKTSSCEPLNEVFVYESLHFKEIEKRCKLRLAPYRVPGLGREWLEVPRPEILVNIVKIIAKAVEASAPKEKENEGISKFLRGVSPEELWIDPLLPTEAGQKLATKLRRLKAELKALERRTKACQQALEVEIGLAPGMQNVATFKFNKNSIAFDTGQFKTDYPDLYDQYLVQKQGSRVLNLL